MQINLHEIKSLTGEDLAKKVDEFQEERLRLFQEYNRLQDIVDQYNDQINDVCIEIEKLNIVLKELGLI
jgi:predicted nuclease with TOPRIM domain